MYKRQVQKGLPVSTRGYDDPMWGVRMIHSILTLSLIHIYDGVEALSLFAGERYDLIVLDIMLPKIDGYGVCELPIWPIWLILIQRIRIM